KQGPQQRNGNELPPEAPPALSVAPPTAHSREGPDGRCATHGRTAPLVSRKGGGTVAEPGADQLIRAYQEHHQIGSAAPPVPSRPLPFGLLGRMPGLPTVFARGEAEVRAEHPADVRRVVQAALCREI